MRLANSNRCTLSSGASAAHSMLLILVVAGCTIRGHSSYLPLASLSRWVGQHGGRSLPRPENIDERIDDPVNATHRIIDLERHQLSEEEYQITEEENSQLKVELLAELLKSHELNRNCTAATKVEQRLQRVEKFQVGDVVEQMYNANTVKTRILYPFQVEEIHVGPNDPQGVNENSDNDSNVQYTIVRLLDGFRVEKIPESFLRQYAPYPQDSKALCNVGEYGIGKERLVPCAIVDYIPPIKPLMAKEHARIKKEEEHEAEYRVRIREKEEIEQNLPMGKLQRFCC